eukprot:3618701-Prymnesium_polylepis.1
MDACERVEMDTSGLPRCAEQLGAGRGGAHRPWGCRGSARCAPTSRRRPHCRPRCRVAPTARAPSARAQRHMCLAHCYPHAH